VAAAHTDLTSARADLLACVNDARTVIKALKAATAATPATPATAGTAGTAATTTA
jgi:hypothetical protein